MLVIDVKAPRFECCLELQSKITVIRGDSGRGKTQFTLNVVSPDPAAVTTISDPSYNSILILDGGKFWYDNLNARIKTNTKGIVIVDDASLIQTKEFAHLVSRDTTQFYIIINRFEDISLQSLNQLPFSIDDVYAFESTGKKHRIVPYYKRGTKYLNCKADSILVEDSGSGYDFFYSLNKKTVGVGGKNNIARFLNTPNTTVLLLADRVALGSNFDVISDIARERNITLLLPDIYLSFEYFLLCSKMFKFDIKCLTNAEITKFLSLELLFEDKLNELTRGKPYQYTKARLPYCYFMPCCSYSLRRARNNGCDNGISGTDKPTGLFNGTKFEKLIPYVRSI